MPIKESAKKALRQSETRYIRNQKTRATISKVTRNINKSIEAKDKAQLPELVKQAIKAIDKAAKKGVIKKNAASRKKSRLMLKVNKVV